MSTPSPNPTFVSKDSDVEGSANEISRNENLYQLFQSEANLYHVSYTLGEFDHCEARNFKMFVYGKNIDELAELGTMVTDCLAEEGSPGPTVILNGCNYYYNVCISTNHKIADFSLVFTPQNTN